MEPWREALANEFTRAESARARGNEGQARVCARRAAGIAIREYLARKGTRPSTASALDLLNQLKDDPHLPPELRLIVDHLTLRVTEDFKLPVDADLVAEARHLCEVLLREQI
jgi:HEPN domain-containing protein